MGDQLALWSDYAVGIYRSEIRNADVNAIGDTIRDGETVKWGKYILNIQKILKITFGRDRANYNIPAYLGNIKFHTGDNTGFSKIQDAPRIFASFTYADDKVGKSW